MRFGSVMLLSLALGVCAAPVFAADANELFAIGAVQKSIGGAGVAYPLDTTWALENPAAMVDLGQQLDISWELLRVNAGASPHGNLLLVNPLAGEVHEHTTVSIPTFGYVQPFEHFALGFGSFGILGNAVDFKHSRTTISTLTHADRRSAYAVAKHPISVAHRFDNGWSVGVAAVGAYTRFRTDSITTRAHPTRGGYNWDSALGAGFEVGVYKRWEKWRLGLVYMSPVWMQNYDRYKKDLIKWPLNLPRVIQAGVAYEPNEYWAFVLDYKWLNWSAVPLLSRKTVRGGLGWRDQDVIKFGTIFRPNDRWTFRAGVSHAQSPIQDDFVFANVLTPAIGQWHLGAGFGYRINAAWTLNLTYAQSVREHRVENGQGDLFSRLGRGTSITYEERSCSAQLSYAFR